MDTSYVQQYVKTWVSYVPPETTTGRFFDKQGKSISVFEFNELMKDSSYPMIKSSETRKTYIFTRWVGIDRSHIMRLKYPVIFETSVFLKTPLDLKNAIHSDNLVESICSSSEEFALSFHDVQVLKGNSIHVKKVSFEDQK